MAIRFLSINPCIEIIYMGIKATVNPEFKLPYTQGKEIAVPYREPVEEALAHFPELTNVEIHFKEKPAILPMKCRPTLRSLLGFRKKRVYEVLLSNKTISELEPALIMNLNPEAKVGVLGLGLAKIDCFQRMSIWELVKFYWRMLFKGQKQNFERRANLLAIRHGLGWQLYEWTRQMRKMEAGNPVLQRHNAYHLTPEEIIESIQRTYDVVKQN